METRRTPVMEAAVAGHAAAMAELLKQLSANAASHPAPGLDDVDARGQTAPMLAAAGGQR